MKSDLLPGPSAGASHSRRALAQPRFLVATMACAMAGFAYLATAQSGRSAVPMKAASAKVASKPLTLSDLPGKVASYGQSRQSATALPTIGTGGPKVAAIGTGESGFNLVETDLTPNSPSDDRQPLYSPSGANIAFISNGKDSNNDKKIDSDGINAEGKYHVWVMTREGANQRQITGLNNSDRNVNQSRPSWSPDGNQLAYINGEGNSSELYVVNVVSSGSTQPAGERRTFFPPNLAGTKLAPAWSPSGSAIVFACDSNLDSDANAQSGQFDLFSINPSGNLDSLRRLTGGTADTIGNTTNELNPAFAAVNQDVIYYSTNRNGDTRLDTGRRIWRMTSNGGSKAQVTDPTKRSGNASGVNDIDDFPSASLATGGESVAFQSNSPLSSTDTAPNGARDYNIWSLATSTAGVFTPPTETEPRVFASDFSGNRLVVSNPSTGQPSQSYTELTGLANPEGVVVQNGFVYVANRGANEIARFDQESGDPAPGNGRVGVSFTAPLAPSAAGMVSDGTYFYVAAGAAISTGTTAATAIYRFDSNGNAAPNFQVGTTGAAFSYGEDPAATSTSRVTGGVEGLTIDPTNQYIFASFFGDDRINVYQKRSGQFLKTFVPTVGNSPLDGPTGLVFGPDLNGDGFQDLYVNASNGDCVLAYRGPNPNNINAKVGSAADEDSGTLISTVVARDPEGTIGNLNAPEGIRVITRGNFADIYVSSFHARTVTGGAPGTGTRINRYTIDLSAVNPATPSTQVASPRPRTASANPNDATWITFTGAQGIGYFDFNILAKNALSSEGITPTPTPVPPPAAPVETAGAALVVTNIISSPENYNESGLVKSGTNVTQDKADDVEPTYSRLTATPQLATRLAFSSTRRYAPSPSSNTATSASNPFGYDEASGNQGTHDIWGTSTKDTTPPALIPQAAGNLQYPVVSPHPDAPFFAPRTYEEGLRAGDTLQLSFVLSDQESGLNLSANSTAITATYYQAGEERFSGYSRNTGQVVSKVNESISVKVGPELKALPVTNFTNLKLRAYDDGPVSSKGHERQANAVAGDGNYYCAADPDIPASALKTPTTLGDYYLDISVRDQAGNAFTYDNVWGFSTKPFQKATGGKTDLFVSDYTIGQKFPLVLAGNNADGDDGRFVNMDPVESYWLSNPGGQAITDAGALIANGTSVPSTFDPAAVDIWRVLSRGPVPQTVLDSYRPSSVDQLDPNESGKTPDTAFTTKTRSLAVSNASVIWAAPYAGTVFAGPGTIDDSIMQSRLKTFLNAGGRLFVSGRDVGWALTNNGQVQNSFLGEELGANFGGEVATNNVNEASTAGGFNKGLEIFGNDFRNIQIPYRIDNSNVAHYDDAALSQDPTAGVFVNNVGSQAVGVRMDIITPQGTTIPSYSVGGSIVGQRVEKIRGNGLQSRVVYFGFGLEAVNRRYRQPTPNLPQVATNTRRRIAQSILQYFKTGVISGRVINDATNQPLANFLLKVTNPDTGDVYLVRTDSEGNYELSGLPPSDPRVSNEFDGYRVEVAFIDSSGRLVTANTPGAQTSPAGFFGGTTRVAVPVSGGATTTGVNLRPVPATPGSISGFVVTSKGTPTDFSDDKDRNEKSVNLAVLLKSVGETSVVPGGGIYARLTRTDASGAYSFDTVPSNVELTLVFNPTLDDIPSGSGVAERDGRAYKGPNTAIGRRAIPDNRRPGTITLPPGDSFTVNDPDPAKYPNPDRGPAVGSADVDVRADSGIPVVVPEGPSVRGIVTLNGVAAPNAAVELLDSTGKSLSPARTQTSLSDGSYSFSDLTPGNYQVRATATTTDGIKASKTVSFTVVQGTDSVQNINILLYSISGKVTVNGQPAVGATVQLLTAANQPFTPTRQTKTNAAGEYTLTNIPNGSYRVKATQGKTSGSVVVNVTDGNATAETIQLTNQQLSGLVTLRVDGAAGKPLQGATVEVLTTDGKSLSPRLTTTTLSDGTYAFDEVKPGSYKVRASYKGDTRNSSTVSVKASTATSVPVIELALQNLTVNVTDANNKRVSGAALQLILNNEVVAIGVTDPNGAYTFSLIPAGKYTVMATKGNLGGQGARNVTRAAKTPVLVIKLQGDSTGANNPTAFNVKGKIYLLSLPYEIFNNPTQSNVSEQTGKLPAATVKVSQAFTVRPVDATTGVRNYFLQRFDYLTGQYVDLDANSDLVRGVGYLLQVVNAGTSIKMPTDPDSGGFKSAALKALTDPNFEKTFTVTLRLDPSSPTGGENGRNLIGFGFNPVKYGKVNFSNATFTHPDGRVVKSFAEAVKNRWISNQITTIDSRGSTPIRVNATQAKSYGGYFVQTLVNGLKLTFINPVK